MRLRRLRRGRGRGRVIFGTRNVTGFSEMYTGVKERFRTVEDERVSSVNCRI